MYARLEDVLNFVGRTVSHGAPVRVALARASKRYKVDQQVLRDFYRSSNNER